MLATVAPQATASTVVNRPRRRGPCSADPAVWTGSAGTEAAVGEGSVTGLLVADQRWARHRRAGEPYRPNLCGSARSVRAGLPALTTGTAVGGLGDGDLVTGRGEQQVVEPGDLLGGLRDVVEDQR